MRDIGVSQGFLYAAIVEGVLYGFNLALFIVYLFVSNKKGQFSTKVVWYSVYLMFILSTAHLAGSIRLLEEGFFMHSGSSNSYFNNKALPLNLVNRSLYGATMIIGDALLIYRVWKIYSENWRWKVVILPTLTHLGTLACTIHITWELSQLKPGQTLFQSAISATAPAMFALPFMTNVMITILIVVRIKQARGSLMKLSAGGVGTGTTEAIYNRVFWGIIESCVIYPVILLLAIILYIFKRPNALALVTGSIAQVVSIVPTLAWLQIALGWSQYDAAVQAVGRSGNRSGIDGVAMSESEGESGSLPV